MAILMAAGAAGLLLGDEETPAGTSSPAGRAKPVDIIEPFVPTTLAVTPGAAMVPCPGTATVEESVHGVAGLGTLVHRTCWLTPDGRTMSAGWMPAG